MPDVLDKLKGGDLRSIGQVDRVIAQVRKQPALFERLIEGLRDADAKVRMRSADAIEKLTREHPRWLQPFKSQLLNEVAALEQAEVRWHLAQLLPRLELTAKERKTAVRTLLGYLTDNSKIVRTFSLQALFDLAHADAALRERITPFLKERAKLGSPAEKSRAKKLLTQLEATEETTAPRRPTSR